MAPATKAHTPLGPPLRSTIVGLPAAAREASPPAAPASNSRASPYGGRFITTPEQLLRVLVSTRRLTRLQADVGQA